MGDNEEHLGSILFLVKIMFKKKREIYVKRNLLTKHRKRFQRVFFSEFLKETLESGIN